MKQKNTKDKEALSKQEQNYENYVRDISDKFFKDELKWEIRHIEPKFLPIIPPLYNPCAQVAKMKMLGVVKSVKP